MDAFGDDADLAGHPQGQVFDLPRTRLGGLGQPADFVGDDGEAAAMVSGPSRFDRRVERQEISLIGEIGQRAGHFADRRGLLLERRGDLGRLDLLGCVGLDRLDRHLDQGRRLGKRPLQLKTLHVRAICPRLGLDEGGGQGGDGGERLVGGAGGLLGGARNLLHRPPQLLCRAGGLRHAACELFGSGRQTFRCGLAHAGAACRLGLCGDAFRVLHCGERGFRPSPPG